MLQTDQRTLLLPLQKICFKRWPSVFKAHLQDKIELISKHPDIGKPSQKRINVRSVLLIPHNRIYYRVNNNKIEILALFDMRKNPSKKIY